MSREQLAQWVLCFYIYCFLGWVWETCYVSIRKKKFVNRGFMKGPLLPIYGSGALCILFASEPFRGNYVLMVLTGMVMATVLEYATGAVIEALFRVRYWDYSNDFLNINGYVCLKSMLCWGTWQENTAQRKEALQAELQELSSRRTALQEGLRSGYYRGVHGILKRNPSASWKRHPEILEGMKKPFYEYRNDKREK